MSPESARTLAARQSSPDSTGETKKRRMPSGQLSGWRLAMRFSHPIGSEPLEKATFAKRAVTILNPFRAPPAFSIRGCIAAAYAMIVSSISFFVAPITFTGLAALSVETQKNNSGDHILAIEPVVRIEAADHLARRHSDALVDGVVHPAVLLGNPTKVVGAGTPFERADHVDRSVVRTAVHDDVLERHAFRQALAPN